jgi:hypothetical protein
VRLPEISEAELKANMDPEQIVQNRQGIGSANPDAIDAMYAKISANNELIKSQIKDINLESFETNFLNKVRAIIND